MENIITTDGTLFKRSKIDMVNKCLTAIGETPLEEGSIIDELEYGTDAQIAFDVVEDTMLSVQTIGWFFNTDYNFRLYPNETNEIPIPPTVLRIDTFNDNRYIDRGGRVYDLVDHTYQIDADYVEADVVWIRDYDELPIEAYRYISAKAARVFQERVLSAPDLTRITQQEEMDALIELQRRQLQTMTYVLQNRRVINRMSNANVRKYWYRTLGRL